MVDYPPFRESADVASLGRASAVSASEPSERMFSFRYLNGPSQNKVLGLVQALLYCNVREESGNHGSPELHRVIP